MKHPPFSFTPGLSSIFHRNETMDYITWQIYPECITIKNSYRVRGKKRVELLDHIMNKVDITYPIRSRSRLSMLLEWSAHNLLYRLHYKRSHTKSVDLDMGESWWHKILYVPLGLLGWYV